MKDVAKKYRDTEEQANAKSGTTMQDGIIGIKLV